MKIVHTLAWLFFIGVFAFDLYQYIDLSLMQHVPGSLFSLPFRPPAEAAEQLVTWSQFTTYRGDTALDEVRLNTQWDFLFIVGYVTVLINLSYAQMEKEARATLNTLLRFNFVLAFLAGLSDAVENFILLTDMTPYNVGNNYSSPVVFSLMKFIFGGIALLILLFSVTSVPKTLPWKTSAPQSQPPPSAK